jgi:hypothetical protein
MRLILVAMAGLLAGCSAVAEPSEGDLRDALVRRGGGDALVAKLAKIGCKHADDDRYVCDYNLPDCPAYKPQCGRTRTHSGRFAEVAGGWQYLGASGGEAKVAVRGEGNAD